jgi:plasmid stabilization system protein ParE
VKKRLRISSLAWNHIQRAAEWWKHHRDKAPEAFDETLDAAFDRLRLNPTLGTSVRSQRRPGLRVLWLERIGYLLYYRVGEDTIEILALWHASRGSRPRF